MAFKGSGNATMWCRWQSNGTVDRCHAISSVTGVISGVYQLNFETEQTTSKYAVAGMQHTNGFMGYYAQYTTSVRVGTLTDGGGYIAVANNSAIICHDT